MAFPENRGRLLELIHGEIREKMPTQLHGMIAANITIALGGYVKQHKMGRFGSKIRHGLPADDDDDRIPDLSLILDKTDPIVTRGAVQRMPDLAIEIKSPDDSFLEMREKAHYYLVNGAQVVWLVYPEKYLVEVYQAGEDVAFYTAEDTLTGGQVLPDFQLPVKTIFELD